VGDVDRIKRQAPKNSSIIKLEFIDTRKIPDRLHSVLSRIFLGGDHTGKDLENGSFDYLADDSSTSYLDDDKHNTTKWRNDRSRDYRKENSSGIFDKEFKKYIVQKLIGRKIGSQNETTHRLTGTLPSRDLQNQLLVTNLETEGYSRSSRTKDSRFNSAPSFSTLSFDTIPEVAEDSTTRRPVINRIVDLTRISNGQILRVDQIDRMKHAVVKVGKVKQYK